MGKSNKGFVFTEDEEKLVNKFCNDKNNLKTIVSVLASLDKNGRNLLGYFINKDIFIDKFKFIQDFVEFYNYFLKNYPLFEKCYMNECLDEIIKLFFNNDNEQNIQKVEKESVDIYSVICPKCGDKFILGELDEEELTEYNFNCPHCKLSISLDKEKNGKFFEKETIVEKEIKFVSYEEALKINMVNPGTILASYNKRNFFLLDSNPIFWPDNISKEIPIYFTTISFE